jgi:hypothetical protein
MPQDFPTAHCAPPLHLHWPPLQPFDRFGSQTVQTAPPAPHAESVLPAAQPFPLQQPLGHDVGLHWQVPPSPQYWPVAHAGPLPQLHAPPLHPFARVGLQGAHAAPLIPHALAVGGATQVFPLQQPFGQEAGLQTHVPPSAHAWPVAHADPVPQRHAPVAQLFAVVALQLAQTAPPLPQLPNAVPVTHAPPLQQPVGHVDELHTQVPPSHAEPTPHEAWVPHWHAPVEPHVSARVVSQGTHAPPLVPQLAVDFTVQVAPAQQPVAQLPALQPLHAPF